ncbi:MAG: deoxyguanosinetriphosphate triphosphohydrolase [Armatimonadetes bacterium]|nr:deoxyguanosinetriphosphate triphosphohydrolase [Armatimonadota bacterium]
MSGTIRERTEAWEAEYLSPYAQLSAKSRGRLRPEEPCPVRTCYQRDRDRIIHLCRAFRRLAHKTQVFFSPREDHLRTRLSHTLEVAQIARTIAKALRLNEELTEAIALAHDVGHTPFGHCGEEALDVAYRAHDPDAHFHHAEHSLRVVDVLERSGQGLNLTHEVREGILAHPKALRSPSEYLSEGPAPSLEAQVVRVADQIAYLNHDLDDCLRTGVLREEDLPEEVLQILGRRHSQRVGRMVLDVIEHSLDSPRLAMSEEVAHASKVLMHFMDERVYHSPLLEDERRKVRGVVQQLFDFYMSSDEALRQVVGEPPGDQKLRARLVCDYVAGMTDRFAHAQYVRHFLPSGFPSFDV